MKSLFLASLKLVASILLILWSTGCTTSNRATNSNATLSNPTASVTSTSALASDLPPTVDQPTSTPDVAITNEPDRPVWAQIAEGTLANHVRSLLIEESEYLWAGGPGGLVRWDLALNEPTVYAISANPEDTNVIGLNQTPDRSIWVGTFGNGIAKFDGVSWQSFTARESLPGDYVMSQTVSPKGVLWLSTKKLKYDGDSGQEFYFGQFDGKQWSEEIGGGFTWLLGLPDNSIVGARGDTGIATHDSLIGIYDGQKWKDLGLQGQTITAIAIAPDGVIWVATSDNIFRYVNSTWHELTPPWIGQTATYVSSIAIGGDGIAWFGFSYQAGDLDKCGSRIDTMTEWGVYRYDGKSWTHFTTEDGLIDNKICTIAIDENGNAWFGSFDKGISRFNGQDWKTYAIP